MAEPAGSVGSGNTGNTEAGIHTAGTGSGMRTRMYLILFLSACSIARAIAKLPTDADCTSTYRSMGQDAM